MTFSLKQLRSIAGITKSDKPKRSAKEAIDVRQENTKLFSFLAIETGSICNRSCSFCPVSHYEREADEWMSIEMFTKIIDELVLIRYTGRIALYSYNEPVRDPRLPDLIRLVRAKLPRVCIMINSNGDYFKGPEDIWKLYEAGLNQMQINIYNAPDGSGNADAIEKGIERCKVRFAKMKSWVDSLPELDQEASIYQHIGANAKACQVVPKWNFQPTSEHDNDMPSQEHGISTRHHIANRAGAIPNFMPSLAEPMQKMCIRPFRALTINWRGDTMLCCNDYHASASTGNVRDKSLIELWNDPRYHAYRIKLLAKDRNIHLCDVCDYNGGFYQHNVQHVTMGDEEDARIVGADMRSSEAAGFGPAKLVQIRTRKERTKGPIEG